MTLCQRIEKMVAMRRTQGYQDIEWEVFDSTTGPPTGITLRCPTCSKELECETSQGKAGWKRLPEDEGCAHDAYFKVLRCSAHGVLRVYATTREVLRYARRELGEDIEVKEDAQ